MRLRTRGLPLQFVALCTLLMAPLSTAPLPAPATTAALPAQAAMTSSAPPVSIGTVQGSFFTNPTNSGGFNISPGTAPVFTEQFQTIDFNPPASAQVTCSNSTGVSEYTTPFADVIPQGDGTCAVQYAQGNGYQAGVGSLASFEAVFTATLTVQAPGQVTFNFYSDDGWILSAGPNMLTGDQPTYVSGSMAGKTTADTGPFTGYPVVGAYNQASSPAQNTVTVTFPKAGSYPIEVDYTECCTRPLALTLGTSYSNPVPPQSLTGPMAGEALNGSNAFENSTSGCTGHPINCATGDFWHAFNDFSLPGRGIPLQFTHTYNSLRAAQDSPLGFGWTDSYNLFLTTDASGAITVTDGNGSTVPFTPNGSGGYQAPSRVLATLVQNANGTFTLTRNQDQERFVFTAPTTTTMGQLTQEFDRNNVYTTTLSYSNGKLATVTDPAGRALALSYNNSGRLASVGDPSGRTVSFSYDTSGNLTAVTDVAGGITRFTYDGSHRLLTMTDPRGGVVTNAYDSAGRVISQTDPLSRTTTLSYSTNSDGSQTTVITDGLGHATAELYDNNELISLTKAYGTPRAATWTYSYDPTTLGVAAVTDPNGHTWRNTWDARGNLLSSTDPLTRTTSYAYDSLNDTTAITDPTGIATLMT
jgi:YD repeat-containing protein